MDERRRILKDGAIAIEAPYIVDVGKTDEVKRRNRADVRIETRGKLVMPGLIDSHEHSTQMLARGLADDLDLGPWFYDRILPYESAMTVGDVLTSSMLCCAEMIRNGTTTFADPGGHHMEKVADAIGRLGMRGVISYGAVDTDATAAKLPERISTSVETCIRETEALLHACDGAADGRVKVSASLRGDTLVSQELIAKINELAERHHLFIQMHTANTKQRIKEFEKSHNGVGVIEYFDSLGVLGPHWLLAHAVFLRQEQVNVIAKRRVSVCHNPGSSLHGAYGSSKYGKFPELMARGANVSLGCDAAAANNSLDMFIAMRQAATIHKEARASSRFVSPEQALEMATVNGARAIHHAEIGSIEKGKRADLIILGIKKPNSTPLHDFSIVPTVVYSLTGADVESVMVDGRIIMEDRKLLTVDDRSLIDAAQKAAEQIVDRAKLEIRPRWLVD